MTKARDVSKVLSPPMCRVNTTSQSWNPTDWTVILTNPLYNVNSIYNISNGRMTAPVSGYYQISAAISAYSYGNDNAYVRMGLIKNGTVTLATDWKSVKYILTGTHTSCQINGTFYLNAGDYLTITTGSNSGMTAYATGDAWWFEARLVAQ